MKTSVASSVGQENELVIRSYFVGNFPLARSWLKLSSPFLVHTCNVNNNGYVYFNT